MVRAQALEVEAALARSSTAEQKVAVLMGALEGLQEARGDPALHVSAAVGGGGALEADTALMEATIDMVDSLARKHGVEEAIGQAFARQHSAKLAGMAGVWGSGMDGAPLARLTCANIDVHGQHVCTGPASFVCGRCKLVAYCSRECQVAHRAAHKADCCSRLAASDWAPAWAREGRSPSFVSADPGSSLWARMMHYSQPRQFLWGNTPAFSLVPKPQGSATKGSSSSGGGGGSGSAAGEQSGAASSSGGDGGSGPASLLSTPEAQLCFAASGDLRNVIATVNGLDPAHEGLVVVHVNDIDPTTMARNFVMLLLLAQEGPAAADAVIQLWYSTALTAEQRFAAKQAVSRALGLEAQATAGRRGGTWSAFQAMRGKLQRPDGASAAVTLEQLLSGSQAGPVCFYVSQPISGSGGSSVGSTQEPSAGGPPATAAAERTPCLTADFPPEVWVTLMHMLSNQAGLQECMHSRAAALRNQSELDKRDRYLQAMEPFHRVSWAEFYDQGMLLPLGALNAHHNAANTFLFHPKFGFTLGAGSDPLQGWPLAKVMEAGERHRVPANDLYGALFFYLREQLGEFAARLRSLRLEFRLTAQPAHVLAPRIKAQGLRFDFIDTSNIADPNYMGVRQVVEAFGPLLNRDNPHACLLTLFMNYVADMPDLHAGLGVPPAQARLLMKAAAEDLAGSKRDSLMAALEAGMAALSVSGARGSGGRRRGERGFRPSPAALAAVMGMMEDVEQAIKEKQDYSGILRSYLQRKGALAAAAALGLRPRGSPHHIVPPRFFVPLGAAEDALPFQGMSDREVYLGKCFSGATLLERYVEWVAA